MEWTSLNDLREKFLKFFESKGHLSRGSYPLVPESDKSLLLIVAGMAPLKKYFTGEAEPPRRRMATCQKCIRTNDIEHVGYTARHGTFFEMLGNFSFGDYFKEEALVWAWEFLTETLAIPADLLWPSVYEHDDEAYAIWRDKIGVREDHIVRLGKADNFWEHGSGPCGPCSEIYFDRGEKYGCGSPDCRPGCDCDRYMEIWNNVFSQFNNDGAGNYTELANKNIDTGMGLERLACVMQGVDNMFEVDTIQNIIKAISEKAGVSYKTNEKADVSLRIIADHARASAFLIADGVMPSNEGRGYVLRRLMRRACRHGRILGIKGAFLCDIMAVVARENKTAYPELTEKLDYVQKIVRMEEERFNATVEAGMNLLDGLMAQAKADGKTELGGADVFKLSDTYGFPLDLTREIAEENGLGIDEKGFEENLLAQKQRARAARGNISGWDDSMNSLVDTTEITEFTGYSETVCQSKIIAIIDSETDKLTEITNENAVIITNITPFYGEGGGQVGDIGTIESENGKATVIDTKKNNGVYMHVCKMESGSLSVGDTVTLRVDSARRAAIARNHSSVHLLDAALREVLGTHIRQAGSYVDNNEARFDFTHFSAVTPEELAKVELLVNEKILEGISVSTFETDIESAKASGAIALFGEKYGKTVRVVKMGDFSAELCGGTHVDNTAKIGMFKITSEASVAAGTRRITAVTGLGAYAYMNRNEALITSAMKALKAGTANDILGKINTLSDDLKATKKELEAASAKLASAKAEAMLSSAVSVGGVRVASMKTELPVAAVRTLGDDIKSRYADMIAVVSSLVDGKLTLVCVCGKEVLAKGIKAPLVLKELSSIVGGGGGGRPDSATAGAKKPEKLDEALQMLPSIIEKLLK
ncbi:MAG: alanine--tRNA ligase [Ruminococcaceae bacterium]|nr:alanine--tRNA ligase [Oscillospiraceae bacterium]